MRIKNYRTQNKLLLRRGVSAKLTERSTKRITLSPDIIGSFSLRLGHRTALVLLTPFTTVLPLRYPKGEPFGAFHIKKRPPKRSFFVNIYCHIDYFTVIPCSANAAVMLSTTVAISCFVSVLSRERKEKRRVVA